MLFQKKRERNFNLLDYRRSVFLAKDNKKIRLFISVELSPPVRKEIERFLKKVKRSWFPVRWVLPKNIHITLAFLGWQQKKFEVKTVELIRDCIKKAIEGIESLEVKIRDIGCFPNERRPRVIWLGLAGELKSLALLHKQVNQELKKVGFTLEERKFIPHLTLGRVERKIGVGALRNLGDQVSRMKVEEFRSKILVEKVSLMESRLRREGSEYRELTSVKLK